MLYIVLFKKHTCTYYLSTYRRLWAGIFWYMFSTFINHLTIQIQFKLLAINWQSIAFDHKPKAEHLPEPYWNRTLSDHDLWQLLMQHILVFPTGL